MAAKPIRVVIVDDHPIIRAGVHTVLGAEADIELVGAGSCAADAFRLVPALNPEVLILDVNLPDINGLEVTRRLRSKNGGANPELKILILTVLNENKMVFGLLEAGASGYVLKDDALEVLAPAIRAVAQGDIWLSSHISRQVVQRALVDGSVPTLKAPKDITNLTRREHEVLQLIALGHDNDSIARKLTLTTRTVQNHVSTIYSKLGVESRAEAILYAIRRGFVNVGRDDEVSSQR